MPAANGSEASCCGAAHELARHLREVCEAQRGLAQLRNAGAIPPTGVIARQDSAQVRGQFCAKRALEMAAIDRLGLSARAYHRVLKLARTAADLAAEPQIRRSDVSEAIGLRTLDRVPREER